MVWIPLAIAGAKMVGKGLQQRQQKQQAEQMQRMQQVQQSMAPTPGMQRMQQPTPQMWRPGAPGAGAQPVQGLGTAPVWRPASSMAGANITPQEEQMWRRQQYQANPLGI